jgi:ribose transport system substrate-binding protein
MSHRIRGAVTVRLPTGRCFRPAPTSPSGIGALPLLAAGLVLAVAAPIVLTACGGGVEKTPLVGVTLLNKQDFFYQDLEAGMREAAATAGLRLLVQSAEKDLAAQTAQVENFIVRGVAAVVVCPVDSRGIAQVLARAEREGVAVFTADIAAEGIEVVAHVASDNVQGGRLAGEFLARALGGRGAVAIVDHPEVASVQDRTRGFLETIAENPGLVLASRQPALGRRDLALDVATGMLQAHPDIRGIFAINDETALGVIQALKALNREDVVVVGYDAIPEARAAILAGGPLKADVVQFPRDIGRRVIEAVAAHLKGERVDRRQPVAVGIVTRETLQQEAAVPPGSDR